MGFIDKEIITGDMQAEQTADAIYSALSAGDIVAAWVMSDGSKLLEKCMATIFNHAVCLALMEEYDKALIDLKKAQLLLPSIIKSGKADRDKFKKAIMLCNAEQYALKPLSRLAVSDAQYAEMRIKWLIALCCKRAGKSQEAVEIYRWLNERYGIATK